MHPRLDGIDGWKSEGGGEQASDGEMKSARQDTREGPKSWTNIASILIAGLSYGARNVLSYV